MFIDKSSRIFCTEVFYSKFEKIAQENVEKEISLLEHQTIP